jgi:hypothetical protein
MRRITDDSHRADTDTARSLRRMGYVQAEPRQPWIEVRGRRPYQAHTHDHPTKRRTPRPPDWEVWLLVACYAMPLSINATQLKLIFDSGVSFRRLAHDRCDDHGL